MKRRIASVLVVGLVGAVLPVTPVMAGRACFGKDATIVGTHTDPHRPRDLVGTPGDDVIVGLGGWDLIDGRGGHDLICSGGGDDYVDGGPGNDSVRAGGGMDTLVGRAGRDRLWGGRAADSLLGGADNDHLYGGGGHGDSLVGGPGNDRLDGGRGYDLAEFWTASRGVVADLRDGTAVGDGTDRMTAIEGLIGSGYNDSLFGDELSNMIRGGSGDDHIEAFGSTDGSHDIMRSDGGNDTLDGGDGLDLVSYNLSPYSVQADLATGEAVSAEGFGHDTLIGIEFLNGSKYDDSLFGDDGDNAILPSGGTDVVDGRGGRDEVAFYDSRRPVQADLGAGTATAGDWGSYTLANFEVLTGSAYRDVLIGDDSANEIWGGGRGDTLRGLGDDDVLVGGNGVDDADGGEGVDECEAETVTACELERPVPTESFLGRWGF